MKKVKWCNAITGILFLSLLGLSPVLQANQFVMDIAYRYETGDYGSASDTDATIIPVLFKYYTNVWSFAAEISYVSITGSETVIPGTHGQFFGQLFESGSSASTSKSVTRSGQGDIRLSLSRAFFPQQKNDLFYEVTASVKIATADEQEFLGTGEDDYSIKLKASKVIGLWKPVVTVGYQFTGDSADVDYNNTVFFSAGTGYKLNKGSSLGLGYDFQQAVTNGADDYAAVTLNYSTELENNAELNLAIKTGLTNNSLDRGLSVSASIPF